jgi:integrase
MRDLTVKQIASLTGRGAHRVSRNLYLQISPNGARSWLFRYMRDGRAHGMGLGPVDLVPLAVARDKATTLRKQLYQGTDPLEARRQEQAAERAARTAATFRDCAEAYLNAQEAGWRNAKHRQQWRNTLEQHVYPVLGDRRVREIETEHVQAVLAPIWRRKTETASRVRQRIERVLDYATTLRERIGANPARWRGHLENLLPKPKRVAEVVHHAALPYAELPELMRTLGTREPAARALRFAILTAARSGEVRSMRWREVDLGQRLWTIPAERMKARVEHVVALSDAALELLGERGAPDAPVFVGRTGALMTDVTLSRALRRCGYAPDVATVHGMRSTFRDWAGEATSHPREVIEHALAHKLRDKTEAAYARGTLLPKRRQLMADWARHCTMEPGARVIALR